MLTRTYNVCIEMHSLFSFNMALVSLSYRLETLTFISCNSFSMQFYFMRLACFFFLFVFYMPQNVACLQHSREKENFI